MRAQTNLRVGYLASNAFELFVCLLAMLTCVQFFLDPGANVAVGTLAHPWDYVWNGLYGAGALLVVFGLVAVSPRIEVVGLFLFTAAVLINLVIAIQLYAASAWVVVPVYVGFALASLVRAHFLFRSHRFLLLHRG